MANLWLGYTNRVDEATLAGATSPVATLPRTNMQDRQLAKVCKWSATSVTLDVTFTANRKIRAVALVGNNLGAASTWSMTASTSSLGATDVYSSGSQNVWSMSFDADLIEQPTGISQYMTCHFISAVKNARYWRLSLTQAVGSDVQIGRLWMGNGITPVYNASFGLQDAFVDYSTVETADSGAAFVYERKRQRRVRFVLDWLDQSSEFPYFYELLRRQGTVGEVLYVPDTASAAETQRVGFLGTLRELSPAEYPKVNARRLGFEMVEWL